MDYVHEEGSLESLVSDASLFDGKILHGFLPRHSHVARLKTQMSELESTRFQASANIGKKRIYVWLWQWMLLLIHTARNHGALLSSNCGNIDKLVNVVLRLLDACICIFCSLKGYKGQSLSAHLSRAFFISLLGPMRGNPAQVTLS